MGYTHSFRFNPSMPSFQDAWPRMVADARAIVEHAGQMQITICGPHGHSAPKISDHGIVLNGAAIPDEAADSLVIKPTAAATRPSIFGAEPGFVFNTCKTERQPYDVVVAAILLRCARLAPDAFRINSDGGWNCEWIFGAHHTVPSATPPFGLSARALVAHLFCDTPRETVFTPTPCW